MTPPPQQGEKEGATPTHPAWAANTGDTQGATQTLVLAIINGGNHISVIEEDMGRNDGVILGGNEG